MDVAMFAIANDVESDANDMRVFESESDESIATLYHRNHARLSATFRCA
jgi:hypothetical protein